jgi:hypothetical protein
MRPFALATLSLSVLPLAASFGCQSRAAPPPSSEIPASSFPVYLPPAHWLLAPNRPRPRGETPEVASPLHAWAIDHHLDSKLGSRMDLCPVRGAVFLCGRPGVYRKNGEQFIHDVDAEAGLAHNADGTVHGFVTQVLGRWPDDAWLVSDAYGIPPYPRTVYHWSGERWTVAAPDIGLAVVGVLPWRRGGALVVEDESPNPLKSWGIGASKGSSLSIAPAAGRRHAMGLRPTFLDDGAVLAAVRFDDSQPVYAVERWAGPSAAPSVVRVPPPDVTIEGVFAPSSNDVAVFGETESGEEYIEHFDGTAWTRVEPPPGYGSMQRYARAGDTEWALSLVNGVKHCVWSREPSGAWQAETMPKGLQPEDLWATGDGTVWILASGQVDRGGAGSYGALLLSTAVPQREIDLAEE